MYSFLLFNRNKVKADLENKQARAGITQGTVKPGSNGFNP
jgi:hypothetical protein